ncbi:hypothetical protein V5I26_004185 [Salmonella enterica subsp. diarizonae serovar 11:k:z53]
MFDEQKVLNKFNSLSEDERDSLNSRCAEETRRQFDEFQSAYVNDECYLCGKSFKTISKETPCLHWLLRRCKFKTKDFSLLYNKYGYVNIAAFLRWCANMEKPLVNINDLPSEMPKGKVLSSTIKWKNVEWTFDCSESDFRGHAGTAVEYPHYHFQMRIDGMQFINFNTYHLPFSQEDLFALTMGRNHPDKFIHNFGQFGMGMEAAMAFVEDDPELALEHMSRSDDEESSTYHISTLAIAAEGEKISGDLIAELIKESRVTGVPLSKLMQERLPENANVRTMISPSEAIPEIASRTEHKK